MKKSLLHLFLLILICCNCKSYRNEIKEYENDSFDHVKIKFLKHYEAENSKYSVLEFGFGFCGDKYTIINNHQVLYDSVLNTNLMNGHAMYIRINNNCNTKISNNRTGKKIIIQKDLARKYKYIYINHKREYLLSSGLVLDSMLNGKRIKNNEKLYKVTYSNSLLGLM